VDLRGRKWQEAAEDCIMRNFITYTLHKIYECCLNSLWTQLITLSQNFVEVW
jgi:hypothetical protein